MDQATRKELSRRLEGGTWDERIDAARELGLAGVDSEGVLAALRFFMEQGGSDVGLCVQDGLLEGAPATVGPLIDVFRSSKDAELSGHAGIILGEIAYQQGTTIDPRIIAAAIEHLRWSLANDLVRGEDAVSVLRKCVWQNRVPEALPVVEEWLDRIATTPDHDGSYAFRAMELILAHRGATYVDVLRKRRDALAPNDQFRETLDNYLELKSKGEVFD